MSFDPSTATPDDGAFDPSSATLDNGLDTRTVLQAAVQTNPDQAAKASKLAKKYDAPDDVLYRNLQNVELIDAVNRYDEKLKTSPKLAEAMRRKPALAKQAHDDIEPLAKIESNMAATTAASLGTSVLGLSEGVWRIPDAAQRGVGYLAETLERTGLPQYLNPVRGLQDLIRLVSEGALPTGYKFGAGTTDVANLVKGSTQLLTDDTQTFGTAFADNAKMAQNADKALKTAIETGQLQQLGQVLADPQYWLSFMANAAPSLAAAYASGGSVQATMLLEALGESTSAADFEQRTGTKISNADYVQAVAQTAVINGLLEKYGLDKVMGVKGQGIAGLFKAITAEGGTEVLQQINNNLAEAISYDGGKSLTDGLVASFMGGAGSGGALHTVNTAAGRVQAQIDKQEQKRVAADKFAAQMQDAMQTAAESKLRERNPEEFRELMQTMTDGKVYVDGQVLNQLPPEVRAALPQAVQDQIDVAAATGDTVEIPVADVLTAAPGTPLEQMFVEHARTDPFAMSQAEAREEGAKATEFLQARFEEAIANAQDQDAFRMSAETVRQNLLDQLNTTGRYRPAVAEGMSQWVGAFYSTMASRLGMTPEEMYAKYPLRILGEAQGKGAVLNAGGKPGEVSVEGYHFSMADRPTLSTEFFGRGLKGSARDEIMSHPDERIKQRLSFYVDLGNGILPETGVGGRAHRAQLTNIYDSDLDPLKLRSADARAFESKVLDAGFSGYLSRMGGASQGQVILLGKQSVQPELLGPKSRIEAGQRAPALPTEPAKWEVQASGEPSMLQAKLERMQSNPSWAGYDMRVEGRELQVRKKGGVFEQSVSTRLPTAKKALENPLEDMLIIGLEAAKADPKAFEKNVELIRQYPNFRDNKSASTPDKAAEQFIKHVVDNLLWLYDQVPAATRQRSKLWYDGARAIVDRWVPKYNVTDAQAAGMLAVLSPQKDWFQNVSLAERVLDVMTTKQDFAWSDEMSQTAASIGALNPEDVGEITGKTLGEIDSNYLQAVWVRVYDQTYNERGYRVVSPEGDFTDWVYNTDGTTKSKTAWGSFNEIGKAISIFKDGSVANISASLGEQHKVRNFYNNIFNPASQHGDVTIDTHAVAAGLLRPLSGSAAEVIHNFGAGGAASSSVFGSKGTYGIYAEAYRRAADQRGVLPREMQSITWEAVRGLYTAGFKAQASNVAKIDAVWEQYKKRRISLDEARKQLLDLSGGIAAPEWERPSAGTPEAAWASSYTGELRQDSGTDRTAGPGAGGVLAQSEPGDLTNGRPEQTGDRGGRYSSGSLAPLEGAPAVAGAAGPDPKLVAVAEQYARDNGIDLRRQDRFVDVDEARAARIAQAYAEMRHAPNDPKVKEAYDDLIRQTRAQYDALVAAGYEFTFFDETGDPYGGNPWNAMRDLRANQRMAVYGTYAGFGVGAQVNIGLADPKGGDNLDPAAVLKALREVGAETEVSVVFSSDTEPTLVVKIKNALTKEQGDRLSEMLGQEAIAQRTDDEQGQLFGPMAEKWGPYNPEYFVTATGDRADAIANPLLRDTGLEWPDQNGEMRPVLANDLFRAVHDAFGHGLEGAGFRARGEENAWQAHVRLFTGSAVGAITSETRGQNSWLNYGPHGEKNRTAPVEDTVFADQKTGLMPEWTWTEGRAGDFRDAGVLNQARGGVTQTPKFKAWFGDSRARERMTSSKQKFADMPPMVMYHTTRDASFTAFEANRPTINSTTFGDVETSRAAIFFTPSVVDSNAYGELSDGRTVKGAATMPVYLKAENPLWLSEGLDEEDAQKLIAAGLSSRFVYNALGHWSMFDDAEGRDLVEAFKRAGYDSVVFNDQNPVTGDTFEAWAVFDPTQIKSAIGNSGEFDPTNPNILKQGPRGTFNPSTLELVLNPNADLSTFFHETGHFFLEVMADIASQPNAPAQIADDMNKLLAWFGVQDVAAWNAMTLDQKRKYHERFAESIEQYLMEGKAPSLELQPVMRRFRAWLLSVYKSIQQFVAGRPDAADMSLNDEIRSVMDRMVATDEQIAQANEIAGLVPDAEADAAAAERLQARSMRDLKWMVNVRDKVIKKLTKQARTIEKDVRTQVTAEVEQMPEVRAKQALAEAEAAHEADPISADFNAAAIADAFGFPTVDAMYAAIERFGDPQVVIDGMTEQRMLEDHGDLIDERAIQEAANEAIHNEVRARVLATELRTQREMLNPRRDTGETTTRGSKITVNALVEAAKQFGQNVADRTVLKDMKAKIWQHTAAERRAAKAWQEATAAGKTQEAVKAKQDQMLQNAAAKSLLEAKAEAQKILDFFKRVTKGNDETVVEKGRDPDIVNAARAVLAAYGVETTTTKRASEYLELVKKHDPEAYSVIAPGVEAALAMAQPLDALTFEELQGLHEEIQALWYKAKASRQIEIDGDLMDIQDAEDELKATNEAIGIPDTMPGDTSGVTPAQARARKLQHYLALSTRAESWAGLMGPAYTRYVWNPIKEAATAYRTDSAKYIKALRDLLEPIAPTLKRETIAAPELNYTFGEDVDTDGVGMNELLHALLHTGNDSNKRKLLLGRGWATDNGDGTIDTTQWDAFIKRMQDEGRLTKAHYDFAQGVWDLLEDTKAKAQETHRRVFGRYFAEVTADEFETPFGTYRGGYVPATPDARTVSDAASRRLAEDESAALQFAFPTTAKGFTKGRVEYNVKLRLDLRTLSGHLDKVLLFSNMEAPVRDVRRLLTRKGVAYGLNRINPEVFDSVLTPWLNRASKQLVADPSPNSWQGWRMWSTLRNRAGMAAMFGNVANAVQQVAGFSMAAVKVSPKFLVKATAQFVAAPRQTADMVAELSPYMAQRLNSEAKAMTEAVNDILLNPSVYESGKNFVQRHAYFAQSAVASVMEPIIWAGAYNEALAGGASELEAVRAGDAAVRQTQGANAPEDISSIEAGSPFARMFNQFAGYFNMQANLLGTEFAKIARDMGLRKGAGRGLYVLTFGFLVNAWVAEAVMQLFKGGPDDEDKDGEYLDDWLAQVFGWSLVRSATAIVPVFGQAAVAVGNAFNNKPYDDRLATSPAISMIESAARAPVDLYKTIVEGEDVKASKTIRDVGTAISMLLGVPVTPVTKAVGYVADTANGDVQPTGTADAVRGAVTGTPSPESKR